MLERIAAPPILRAGHPGTSLLLCVIPSSSVPQKHFLSSLPPCLYPDLETQMSPWRTADYSTLLGRLSHKHVIALYDLYPLLYTKHLSFFAFLVS